MQPQLEGTAGEGSGRGATERGMAAGPREIGSKWGWACWRVCSTGAPPVSVPSVRLTFSHRTVFQAWDKFRLCITLASMHMRMLVKEVSTTEF